MRIAWVGDSYMGGSGDVPPDRTIDVVAGRILGCESFSSAQGGTGWVADGHVNSADFRPFGDASRVKAVAQADPDFIVIVGSVNDENSDPANIQRAVLAGLDAYRAACPEAPIILVGPQPSGGGRTVSASHAANCRAVYRAAREWLDWGFFYYDWTGVAALPGPAPEFRAGVEYHAGDVVCGGGAVWRVTSNGIVNDGDTPQGLNFELLSGPMTGTGKVGAPAGDGTRDVWLSKDGVHPSGAGSEAIGARLASIVAEGIAHVSGAKPVDRQYLVRWMDQLTAYDAAGNGGGGGHAPKSLAFHLAAPGGRVLAAQDGYGYKDGQFAGESILRAQEGFRDGFRILHLDLWMSGDSKFLPCNAWQMPNKKTAFYNSTTAQLKAIAQDAGQIYTIEELAGQLPDGCALMVAYGPNNSAQTSSEGLRNEKALDDLLERLFPGQYLRMFWSQSTPSIDQWRQEGKNAPMVIAYSDMPKPDQLVAGADVHLLPGSATAYDDWRAVGATGVVCGVHDIASPSKGGSVGATLKACGIDPAVLLAYTKPAAQAVMTAMAG